MLRPDTPAVVEACSFGRCREIEIKARISSVDALMAKVRSLRTEIVSCEDDAFSRAGGANCVQIGNAGQA
jgi:hypothetical protein